MAADMLYGGAGLFLCYRLGVVSNAYQIQNASGAGAATGIADAILRTEGYIEESNLSPQGDGTFKGTINNYDVAEEIIDALNILAKKPNTAGGTAPAAIKMEHGVERGGSSSSERPLVFWQSYGPKNSANTKRLMHWGIGRIGMDSGQIVFKDGQWIKPVINLESVSAEYTLNIPDPATTNLWEPTLVGTAVGALTVPQYSHFERKYLVKGTA
jgi:hypothetical protein